MYKYLSLLLTTMLPFSGFTQCSEASYYSVLRSLNCETRIGTGGNWWNYADFSSPGYEYNTGNFPLGTIVPGSIFAGSVWMGGIDQNNNLKLATKTYGSNYSPGPIINGTVDHEICNDWDKVFAVTKEEIVAHLADFQDNGQIDNTVASNILSWPAYNNPHFEEINDFSLPDDPTILAPFIDQNGDAIYNPMDGDVPNIYGGKEGLWNIFNTIDYTNPDPLKIDCQLLATGYNNVNGIPLGDATIYRLKYTSRETDPISQFYISLWVDFDLGCSKDDYLGCIPDENMIFVYNGDGTDGIESDCDCAGGITFCEEPPIVGLKIIQSPENNQTSISAFSVFTNYDPASFYPENQTSPNSITEHYNYMQGLYKDGAPFIDANGNTTPLMYAGNPSNGQHSMCQQSLDPADIKGLVSFGPFTIEPGHSDEIVFAIIGDNTAVNYPCPNISSFTNKAYAIGSEYLQQNTVTNTNNVEDNSISFELYPNPMEYYSTFELKGEDYIKTISIYDTTGKLIHQVKNIQAKSYNLTAGLLYKGMYLYQVKTHKGENIQGKIIAM